MRMIHDAWLEQLRSLRKVGARVTARGEPTTEGVDWSPIRIDSRFNLLTVPARGLNYRFAVAEWLWIAFGRSDVATIARYNARMRDYSDDGMWMTGAYGPHVNAQIKRTIERLQRDPATRQAVIEIPRPQGPTKDEPCMLSLQFLARSGRLHLIATMRSSDIWLGVPYDIFTFTQLQNCLAGHLGLERGWCSLHAGSSHLYERDAAPADAVLAAEKSRIDLPTWGSPNLPGLPPRWLEDVLVYRDAARIPNDAGPWRRYARALIVPTSTQALTCLRDGYDDAVGDGVAQASTSGL